jgi:hypothetical protein
MYNRKYERCMSEEIPEYRRERRQVLVGRTGKEVQNVL